MKPPLIRRKEYVKKILQSRYHNKASNQYVNTFKPANIALIKYWGKRCGILNLPLVSSLSYSMNGYGSKLEICLNKEKDIIIYNGVLLKTNIREAKRIIDFLDIFRLQEEYFFVKTSNNIPTAAGLASSASGFAALSNGLNILKNWEATDIELSLLARLGSGSACRSFINNNNLAYWHCGKEENGLDSFAEPTDITPDFYMAAIIIRDKEKKILSREAMKISLIDQKKKEKWKNEQAQDLEQAINFLKCKNFKKFGNIVEENSKRLHDLLSSSTPPIIYDTEKTIAIKEKIPSFRKNGLPIYFTQDAGANIKVIFPKNSLGNIKKLFSTHQLEYFCI